ncbi:hypothetical protein SAMN02910262_02164 [[Clostridium] aminophilum]|uniref:Uncharacterized protein n=1 Tax=[Clostridium] aminophilum TaxID=1526 RepID=A0A1I6K1H9_9FIRM|nr:hypothetical protein SAMN02910262_02164 [[Clostridium] aminophilum]
MSSTNRAEKIRPVFSVSVYNREQNELIILGGNAYVSKIHHRWFRIR